MRRTQYSGFGDLFICLFDRMSAMLVVMTVRTVLKVPFEKAAPPPCPSDVPAPLRVVTIVKVGCFAKFCVNKIDCKLNDL